MQKTCCICSTLFALFTVGEKTIVRITAVILSHHCHITGNITTGDFATGNQVTFNITATDISTGLDRPFHIAAVYITARTDRPFYIATIDGTASLNITVYIPTADGKIAAQVTDTTLPVDRHILTKLLIHQPMVSLEQDNP